MSHLEREVLRLETDAQAWKAVYRNRNEQLEKLTHFTTSLIERLNKLRRTA